MSEEYTQLTEDEIVEQAFQRLLSNYLSSAHGKKTDIIKKAYKFAKNAHKGVKRLSGEPYILHPISVANITCKEIGLGSVSICAALLHDVVEDTDYTVEDIQDLFGERVALIVSGLTKISGGVFGDQASQQADNFRRLILSMSEDIRVILIKIADRLHNMQTLASQPVAKQYKIAGETEYIYAPLAHRLGLFSIKTKLEDLSFKYNHPEEYNIIEKQLEKNRVERTDLYNRFALPIINSLNSTGYDYTMKQRVKSTYSIYRKMQKKQIPFEEVFDILAARIVFNPSPNEDEKVECWKVYSTITQIYRSHPERTRDWLSNPKANGYEALHLTVMGPEGKWIEVQIRSKRMDDIAEKGLAAHWKYKDDYQSSESKIEEWLNMVNELLQNPDSDAMNMLDTFKLALFDYEIFVFTPKGEMKTMPASSTVLDFAFEIHSDIGMRCIGAKINNKLVPLNHKLKSGDQVEILTAKKQNPKAEWLEIVTTAIAKSKLKTQLKIESNRFKLEGEKKLKSELKKHGLSSNNSISIDTANDLISAYKANNLQDLYFKVGNENIDLSNLSTILKSKSPSLTMRRWTPKFLQKNTDKNEIELDLSENYRIAKCCNPIPGDDIIGFRTANNEIAVHKRNCKEAIRLKSINGKRIVAANWSKKKERFYPTEIIVKGIDKHGMLIEILDVISNKMNANIKNLSVVTEDGIFKDRIEFFVNHLDDIKFICNEIKKIKGIKSVARVEDDL